MNTTTEIIDAEDALPEMSDATRDYLLSDAGIEHYMRALSDAYGDSRRCPVKRCPRARRCQGPDMICELKPPRLDAPTADIARVNELMRQLAVRDLERFGVW